MRTRAEENVPSRQLIASTSSADRMGPRFNPGHVRDSDSQALADATMPRQKGNVSRWRGRDRYTVQPCSGS
jgi:hypothetical protein